MMEPTIDDQALLASLVAGDQEALRLLYSRYRARLYGYLWLQLERDTQWTEDVLQEVFLGVWRAASSYRGEASVASWLFRIAHHQAQMSRRQLNRRPEGNLAERLDSQDSELEKELTAVSSHEDVVLNRIELQHAFERLSTNHRVILDLVFNQGFALHEVAQILAIPLGTVKSRLTYARRALYSLLTQEQAEQGIHYGK